MLSILFKEDDVGFGRPCGALREIKRYYVCSEYLPRVSPSSVSREARPRDTSSDDVFCVMYNLFSYLLKKRKTWDDRFILESETQVNFSRPNVWRHCTVHKKYRQVYSPTKVGRLRDPIRYITRYG